MRGFQGATRLLVTALRTPRAPRAGVTSKPPEHPLSAAVSTWGLETTAGDLLGGDTRAEGHKPHCATAKPSGWG